MLRLKFFSSELFQRKLFCNKKNLTKIFSDQKKFRPKHFSMKIFFQTVSEEMILQQIILDQKKLSTKIFFFWTVSEEMILQQKNFQ
jgi:hypothetical protein